MQLRPFPVVAMAFVVLVTIVWLAWRGHVTLGPSLEDYILCFLTFICVVWTAFRAFE